MKIKNALLLLATAMAITGCSAIPVNIGSDNSETQDDVATVATTAENDSEDVETQADTASAETSDETTVEGEAVSDAELKEFTELFNFMDLNFGFLYPEYKSPEEIKWDKVIAYYTPGLTLYADALTDEEKMAFYGTTDTEDDILDTVIRKKDLTKFIKDHTGLDVTINAKDVSAWTYNEKYDAFLVGQNPWGQDTPLADGKFVSGTKNGNLYQLTFQPNNENWDEKYKEPDRVITFEKNGDDIVIKSNKILK